MTDMICGNCGLVGIRWMGPFSNLTHTKCPHCGGINCQEVDDDDACERPGDCAFPACECEGGDYFDGGEYAPMEEAKK